MTVPLLKFIHTTSGTPPPLPGLPDLSRAMTSSKLTKRKSSSLEDNAGDGELPPEWKERIGQGWGEDVVIHGGDWEDSAVPWEECVDTYDPDRNPDDDGEDDVANNNVPKGKQHAVFQSWDAILHMPDGTRLLHEVSVYGSLPADVLKAICTLRGWNIADYRVLEHGLPIGADLVHGSCAYDIRLVQPMVMAKK